MTGVKFSQERKNKAIENLRKLAADPKERKHRSDRAKKQHQENNLGISTWTEKSELSRSEKMKIVKSNPVQHKALIDHIANQTSEEMSRRSYMRKIFTGEQR
jgi:CHASE3 domain sensor protein